MRSTLTCMLNILKYNFKITYSYISKNHVFVKIPQFFSELVYYKEGLQAQDVTVLLL